MFLPFLITSVRVLPNKLSVASERTSPTFDLLHVFFRKCLPLSHQNRQGFSLLTVKHTRPFIVVCRVGLQHFSPSVVMNTSHLEIISIDSIQLTYTSIQY